MIFLQLSAGQGPEECCIAVGLALREVSKACDNAGIQYHVASCTKSRSKQGYHSVLMCLEGDKARNIVEQWQGNMLWQCVSPVRPKHKRKNWFFSGEAFDIEEQVYSDGIRFQSCRASGSGGQHVNTTNSAVQATHIETGISVRVESERSQHTNKRLATALIQQKLAAQAKQSNQKQTAERHMQHWQLERGNPLRTFKGMKFLPS